MLKTTICLFCIQNLWQTSENLCHVASYLLEANSAKGLKMVAVCANCVNAPLPANQPTPSTYQTMITKALGKEKK